MRTRARIGMALIAGGMLGCGGSGDTGGSPTTPTAPTTPTTPAPSPTTTPTPSPTPTPTPAPAASAAAVVVQNDQFSPASVTIPVGGTVKWTWSSCTGEPDPYGYGGGQTCTAHSVTWDAGGLASATQSAGNYQRSFDAPGTYTYHCAVHGTAMAGKVVVQ